MAADSQITFWLGRLQAGDSAAAEPLWRAYFARVSKYVRGWLPEAGDVDPDAVAASAFWNMWRAVANHQYEDLKDREGLWALLYRIARRKAGAELRRRNRRIDGQRGRESDALVEAIADESADPVVAAAWAEEVEDALASFGRADLRTVFLMKLDDRSDDEIATALGCTPRTVRNKAVMIRAALERREAEGAGE